LSPQDVTSNGVQEPPITWVDIARTLGQLEPLSMEWRSRPPSLIRANISWLGATFEFSGEVVPFDDFFAWLGRLFPQRLERTTDGASFILEGPSNAGRLAIEVELRETPYITALLPLGSIESSIDFQSVGTALGTGLPLVACHSMKGGNGRTTVAIACATQWAELAGKPVLIVDADLEAPGLSYLYRRARGPAQIAFEDVVALAHSDGSSNWATTIDYVAARLQGQRVDDLFVLPLRRSLDELASSSIRAEHLASAAKPFALAEILRSIAARVGCAGIVVDIRAGLVPLAAQLILDPSVDRIFVSSLAGQSLDGTVALIGYVSREARRRGFNLNRPMLVVNRIPSVLRETGADEALLGPVLEKITVELLKGQEANVSGDEAIFATDDDIQPIDVAKIPEIADLQATSPTWDGFLRQLQSSGFLKRMSTELGGWLEQTVDTAPTTVQTSFPIRIETNTLTERDRRCDLLRKFAGELIAAEVAANPVDTPLITGPLRQLAEQFISQLPIVVTEGAKGTGKTLTARFLITRETWASAVAALSAAKATSDAPILPVLGSIQASGYFQAEIDAKRRLVATSLKFGEPQTVHATTSYLKTALSEAGTDLERSAIWLNAIAWSAGFDVGGGSAGEGLIKALRDTGQQLLAVIEGIEELYSDPFAGSTPAWLRTLLVDIPQRLRSEPSRPLGLIIFVRRDSVDAAVPQNSSQFRQYYKAFALTWSDGDVLELAAWIATKSGALNVWSPDFQKLSQAERERGLHRLWGQKLGPDDKPGKRTAEAYTANWIVAVLSDLQSRLVARDLVRLLESAAASPLGAADTEYADSRLLTPRALKDAVKPTSIAKVSETQEEIGELKPVFDKFRQRPDRVVAPLDQTAIETLGLTAGDITLLQRHGILFGDAAPYEVPELFRMGLNLKHSGARHSVINLRRRARQRLGLPV
jgi:MinD-like ATPase involved in chromosome partitioning or flagellar assembly